MSSWLRRTQAGIQSAPTTPAVNSALSPGFVASNPPPRFVDPNAPDARLDIESRCIYERRLPGNAYITAHVTRLQDGFYDSPSTHGDCINNVRFLALSFVFHPSETINRFQSATVTVSLHDDTDQAYTDPSPGHKPVQEPINKPKFLRFAPHVLFGGVSPETLDWNFNLTGSLGVAQTPVSASLSPSGGVKGSYKLFQMMRIQGSTRTLLARHHHEYDIEDGEVCWTMEENALQKSGLPREMTFVMLITKGDVENVVFDINIHPKVSSRFGHYPAWWNNILKYRPLQKDHMDLDRELGQKFEPELPGRGFNFANLAGTFNDFVSLPGTTYSLTDHAFANQVSVPDAKTGQNVPNQAAKAPSRQNTQGNQSAGGQGAKSVQPPARPQTVPPPSEIEQNEAPMDYHIYLHNPRTINLHATPPPQLSTPGSAPRHTPAPAVTVDYKAQSFQPPFNIPRPHSTAPALPSTHRYHHEHQRMSSPANTKMKRRSIDISNLMNSPYYDEPKVTTTAINVTPQQRGALGRSQSTSGSTRSGSLRRRRSKTDLRYAPLAEENSNPRSSDTSTGRTNSVSGSTSSRSRISLPHNNSNFQALKQNQNSSPDAKSSTSQISPKSIIIEAPSPPDPGLSGFKARLQAHVASERERMFTHPQNRDRDRERERELIDTRDTRPTTEKPTPTDRLPFELKPQPHRPPREMTPSPEPTDDAGSETTSDDREVLYEERNMTPRGPQVQNTTTTIPRTISPRRRERVVYSSPSPEALVIPGPLGGAGFGSGSGSSGGGAGVNGVVTPMPNSTNTTTTSLRSPTSTFSSPNKSKQTFTSTSIASSTSRLPPTHQTSPPPSYPATSLTSLTMPSPPPTSANKPTSPPPPRNPSPYASPKYDNIRNSLAAGQRVRRGSSASLSPDDDGRDSQPAWGDLKEEARRRARKRLSMPVGGFGVPAGVGGGMGGVEQERQGSGSEVRGYEYIVEADGEWDDR